MKTGTKLTINSVRYTIDLVGPRTTLLLRGDGKYVHAKTHELEYFLKWRAK